MSCCKRLWPKEKCCAGVNFILVCRALIIGLIWKPHLEARYNEKIKKYPLSDLQDIARLIHTVSEDAGGKVSYE